MARNKATLQNIDLSDPANYLDGRIKDNTGSGDGTPVNERVYGDFHQTVAKLMQLAGLVYNNLPDNESNGYQVVDAIRQLASKNDFNYDLSTSGGLLTLPIRVGKLINNEIIRCKATVDKGAETQLRGTLDNINKAVTYLGDFKQNEYLRIINLSGSIVIIREVDAFNLETVCIELGFLKAASNAETIAGTIVNKAVTPLSFKTAFTQFVTGANSPTYLATTNTNGLLSAAQWNIINGLGAPALRNRGNFILGDINGSAIGTNFVSTGQITAQKTSNLASGDVVTITFTNAMDSNNYRLDIFVESLNNYNLDNDFSPILFKVVSGSQATIFIEETNSVTQNLKIHIDVIQL